MIILLNLKNQGGVYNKKKKQDDEQLINHFYDPDMSIALNKEKKKSTLGAYRVLPHISKSQSINCMLFSDMPPIGKFRMRLVSVFMS